MGIPDVSIGRFIDSKWIKANELFDLITAKYCDFFREYLWKILLNYLKKSDF